ncbi:uncharacterized protein [Triticum aestivum]|uniref:uncharacterized protein n=1 Tax=Triticum aestivum TaxID=4565 RepID=UPI001D003D5F|nr:uncharacterized protein LOC123058324 [Triticum aestivum]
MSGGAPPSSTSTTVVGSSKTVPGRPDRVTTSPSITAVGRLDSSPSCTSKPPKSLHELRRPRGGCRCRYVRLLHRRPSLSKQPDGGAQDPDDPTDDCYYPEGAYYHVETADNQE